MILRGSQHQQRLCQSAIKQHPQPSEGFVDTLKQTVHQVTQAVTEQALLWQPILFGFQRYHRQVFLLSRLMRPAKGDYHKSHHIFELEMASQVRLLQMEPMAFQTLEQVLEFPAQAECDQRL